MNTNNRSFNFKREKKNFEGIVNLAKYALFLNDFMKR